jgi:protein O-GlcNAc transferase
LPVVTLIGETFAGRVAASLLNALGLPELVTHSRDQYEALAIELARDRQRLADIKARLWGNRLTRPVFDTGSFTRHIEAAYQAMHDRYTEGLAPDHIRIASIAAG